MTIPIIKICIQSYKDLKILKHLRYKVQSCQTGSFSRGIRVNHVEQRYGGEYVMRLKGFKGWICFDGWIKESTSIRKPLWGY